MYDKRELRACMARNGYSISKLAQDIGISYTSLSLKVNGYRDFSREEITKITIALELSPDERNKIFFCRRSG